MKTLMPYLSLDGTCEAAFNFYKSVFGGEIVFAIRYKDIPTGEIVVPESAKEKIMHMVLSLGENVVLMGADVLKEFIYTPTASRDITLSIQIHEESEAKRIFETLSKDGTIDVPLVQTFWAKLYGLCTDQFGIHWMISFGES